MLAGPWSRRGSQRDKGHELDQEKEVQTGLEEKAFPLGPAGEAAQGCCAGSVPPGVHQRGVSCNF